MIPERPIDEALRTLLDAACNDALTDEQFEHLEAALSASEDARQEYLRYFTLTGELRYLLSMAHADAAARERTGMEYVAGDHLADKPRIPSQETSPGVPFPVGIFRGMANGLSWEWTRAYLSATVILGLFLLVASFVYVSDSVSVDRSRQLVEETPEMPTMEFVGRITGMVDVKWSDDPRYLPPPGFAHVPLGRKYILSSGLLEITYDSGAKVILQGPCTYEVESTAGGYLALGKLTARVEEKRSEVRGQRSDHSPLSPLPSPLFSVRTPTALITDLGTEFGVEVDEAGITESHVFRGSVKVLVLDGTGNLPSPSERWAGDEGSGREVILRENESARVQPDKDAENRLVIVRGAADPAGFVRPGQLEQVAKERRLRPLRRWQAFSEKLRKRDDLVAYYDFQPDGDNYALLPNRAATGRRLDGRVDGAEWVHGRFPGRSALYFHGHGSGDKVVLPEPERFNFIGPFSVAVWFKVERFTEMYQALVAKGDTTWRLQQSGDTNLLAFDTDYDQNGERVPHHMPGRTEVADGRWHLAVAVYEPAGGVARKRLYLDGRLEGEDEAPLPLNENDEPVWLGANGRGSGREFWGLIDEAAVFAAALSADEVEAMFQAGSPERRVSP